ncbi:hypothetical protein FPQ18DRAFT_327817 [Pyronema domesticum]|uniref:Similar to RNA-binding protein rnp24 acc. no. Q09100 n=1 Tax=Pyronema omphalodes (strain CBS 100304) TaxID=1076935 RepID=U4L7W5_PYROM|nr:hypothetical protein FPQ18DRAFT_327817 [Pyronema domesticum]CCX13243.1 Similar to RNA-binding protein rnp24; acc. no. Q09100 [Pyronema omphalodes CBS 100304]
MSKSKATTKPDSDEQKKAERKAAKAAAKAAVKVEVKEEIKEEIKEEATEEKSEEKTEKKEKKDKKEKKEKKVKKEEKSEDEPTEETSGSPSKKRKRDSDDDDKLEIDILAPEPPSKKALRKLKKHPELAKKIIKPSQDSTAPKETFPEHSSQARSKYGIWIGNLAFSTDQDILQDFLADGDRERRDDITRVNMPKDPRTGRNKGFAYVDFKSEETLKHVLTLSEGLLGGRRVLIKNSKDFTNRPAASAESKPAATSGANLSKNPPSRILYVGNLEFSCRAEHIKEHFSFAGKIQKVRLATFEDTGKCKGFGFVDFEDKESVKRAMLGLTPEEEKVYEELEGKAEVELYNQRKKRAVLGGRTLTMEYGQDPSVRYKKRFGAEKQEGEEGDKPRGPRKAREPIDNRSADAGAAYSSDVRRTGAITEGKGKKMTFDEE